jgi:hypothetical protein
MKTFPNDPAFPYHDDKMDNQGLSIREHFASLMMQGLLATGITPDRAAGLAVRSADELIEALNAP